MSQPLLLPEDEHNRSLLANVHPANHVQPTPAKLYDLLVIGAGTAGLVSAAGAAGLGARVALIERHLMGGDCLNVGCVPSKVLLRSAHVVGEMREAPRFGVRVGAENPAPPVDFARVMERMREVRQRISPDDSVSRFQDELGVDVFLGEGRFTGAASAEVDGIPLRFKRAVIATGARPVVPPIEGLREAGFRTNETIFELTELPRRLLVLGGGPIGCELAQAFRRFGSEVVIVEMDEQFLPREDPDASQLLFDSLSRDGIDVRLETSLTGVDGTGGSKRVTLERAGKHEILEVDEILVGVGRAPNIEDLGLERAGVQSERSGISVDDHLRTANPRIFAAGDVCMSTKFTHAADFAARAVIQNAFFFGRKRVSAMTIPWCTYTDPEIAHVGLYEREARAQNMEIDTYVRELRDVHRAIAEGDHEGFVKIHVKRGGDQIVGATIVARNAGDMISEVSVAMAGNVGLGRLASIIHPYPTQAEAIRQIGDAYNRTRVTPMVSRLFRGLIRARR